MARNDAKIDENDNPTWTAYNETTGLIGPVRVDPILGYVEVFVVANTANNPSSLRTAKIDENDNATLLGYNETTSSVEALRCSNDGDLLVYGV